MTSHAVTVFFDYTCQFAYRAHRWFDHLPHVEARWRPFSLLEHNYRGDGPPVWRLPERADDISLQLFAGHHWVAADGGDLDRYRHGVFHAWHDTDTRVEADYIVAMANRAGRPEVGPQLPPVVQSRPPVDLLEVELLAHVRHRPPQEPKGDLPRPVETDGLDLDRHQPAPDRCVVSRHYLSSPRSHTSMCSPAVPPGRDKGQRPHRTPAHGEHRCPPRAAPTRWSCARCPCPP